MHDGQPNIVPDVTKDLPVEGASPYADIRERAGAQIGPYRLLEQVGEGGFGLVFRARQERPVQRDVALKIIKLGMDTRQVVARFEQERQALALMDHAHIARVFDAGATDTGRPYFVMEYVRGETIVEYCDKRSATIAERLELFLQVCNAVQHAHTKGIIHRDIKPSNILVASQDDRPVTKVIDFGIAKAAGPSLTDLTLFTQRHQLIGTPAYMSPEQAEGSQDIDTRTDVYSLGVVLYELLTGATPFTPDQIRSATHGDLQKLIREVEPPVPSTRLSENPATLEQAAARRATDARRLSVALKGELDWIVMKAIEKDRQRRYETANGLAMDIRRYLSGEPVLAAPPGAAYRVRKFVSRNRLAVTAGLVVAGALVLGVAGTGLGLVEANRQRRAAEASERTARAEAERASAAEATARERLAESEATLSFLDEMLGAVDPSAQGRDVSVRAVLDAASGGMGPRFADRPLAAARLHGTIGRTYLGLGQYQEAEPHLREQLRLRAASLGAEHEETARAENDIGAMLVKQGKYEQAERTLLQAVDRHERLFGRTHPVTIQSLDQLAALYAEQLRAEQAEPILREVLDARTAATGRSARETLRTMGTLAIILADTGRYGDSEKLFDELIGLHAAAGSLDSPQALDARSSYSWMLYWSAMELDRESRGPRLERSREMGELALGAKQRVLGPEHQSTLTSINNLASVYMGLGREDDAERMRREELAITVRVLGEEHPDAVISLSNLGAILRARGRCDEAVEILDRAATLSRKVFPPDHEGTGFTLGWYASCLGKIGRHADAERAMLEAHAIVSSKLGESNDIALRMMLDIVQIYENWEAAEPGRGHADSAARWKEKLAKLSPPE